MLLCWRYTIKQRRQQALCVNPRPVNSTLQHNLHIQVQLGYAQMLPAFWCAAGIVTSTHCFDSTSDLSCREPVTLDAYKAGVRDKKQVDVQV